MFVDLPCNRAEAVRSVNLMYETYKTFEPVVMIILDYIYNLLKFIFVRPRERHTSSSLWVFLAVRKVKSCDGG